METRNLQDATARPGELALEVIQVGYLRGFLLAGSGPYVDERFFDDPRVESMLFNSAALRSIRTELRPVARDRRRYIEQFIALVERQAGSGNAEAQAFVDVVKDVQERYNLAHPIGLGLAAIHLFQEEARAA